MYVGNYDFWYESSQLIQQLIRNQNKKTGREDHASCKVSSSGFLPTNRNPGRPPAARKFWIRITLEEMPASSRKYPFVGFSPEREAGKDILFVEGLSKTVDGVKVLDNVSFVMNRNDKIALVGDNEAWPDGADADIGRGDAAGRRQL